MSVAHALPAPIRVEAVDGEHAGALVQALVGVFEAEDVALDADSLEVCLWTHGDSGGAVPRVLGAVEAWLAAEGLEATTIHLEGRSHRVTVLGGAATRMTTPAIESGRRRPAKRTPRLR